jgi:hypothetical protein
MRRVLAAKKGGKVILDKYPASPWLARWNDATPCAAAHLFGMHLQERSGFQ